jgi:hypothetical protein
MLAGPYCEQTETRGVLSLPKGHPLEKFIGTEYQSVLEEYLHLSTDNGGATCDLHGSGYSTYVPEGGTALPDRQAQDADEEPGQERVDHDARRGDEAHELCVAKALQGP